MNTIQVLARTLFVALALLGAPAFAQSAPAYIPVQGTLAGDDGAAKDGSFVFEIRLYELATGGTAFYAESQQITVAEGFFTAYVGDGSPADLGDGTASPVLDLKTFNSRPQGVVFMGLSIDGAAELSPRLQLGSVPYAGFAQSCSDSRLLEGRGPGAFALVDHTHTAADVGAAAANHTHSPASIGAAASSHAHSAADVGAAAANHTHSPASIGAAPASAGVPAGAVMFFTGSACPSGWSPLTAANGRTIVARGDGQGVGQTVGTALGNLENRTHTHSVNPAAVTTSPSGTHDHVWGYNPGGSSFSTFYHAPASTGVGFGVKTSPPSTGTGTFSLLGVDNTNRSVDFYTAKDGDHSHTADVGATTSTTAATADVAPYIQLLTCQKD